jgi:AGZA family xanthine/uracil permease-like MFS transporter
LAQTLSTLPRFLSIAAAAFNIIIRNGEIMDFLEKYFKLKENGTTVGTELRAGIATFLTMAYIIVVNPGILSKTGMPFAGVLLATVLVAMISSILMGLVANLPFAVAPGMGINAFFTFSLCLTMGIKWQTALGSVFISGIIFIILSVTGVRKAIVESIPASIRYGVASGIGLFLTIIGLTSVGFIVGSPATTVTFGGMNVKTVLFIIGLIFTGSLLVKNVKGSLIIGIAFTSILALIASYTIPSAKGIMSLPTKVFAAPNLDVFFSLDIVGALTLGMIVPTFTFLFTDIFDSLSTFLGVSEVGGFIDEEGQPKNVGKALVVDAIATTISGLFGTSSGTTYIESASGVKEGGKTGLTAVFTGLLFFPFMFLSPLLVLIPGVATAPILVLIGLFMMRPVNKIDWDDFENSIPAFLALVLIPLTYSITQGIIWGFLSYTALKILKGNANEIPITLYIIDIFAIISLII